MAGLYTVKRSNQRWSSGRGSASSAGGASSEGAIVFGVVS